MKYKGEWIDELIHGTYYINNKRHYEGQFKNGSYNGNGTSYYDNGQIEYRGLWKTSVKSGQDGTLYASNGSLLYVGEFENNITEGIGVFYTNNVIYHVRRIRNKSFNGHGFQIYPDDNYSGNFLKWRILPEKW